MPLVHSSHSCTICRQPRSSRRAFPPWTHTPAYCCAPSGHGRRGASTARARYLSHSANTQPNPSPAAQPLASRVGVTGRGPGSPSGGQRHQNPLGVAGGGVPQLRFNSWQGEGKAAAEEGSRGSSGLGNPEGWSVRIRREERGARWPERGGQDLQERGTPRANARPRREPGRGRKDGGQDAGSGAGGTHRPPRGPGKAGTPRCWGRGAACQADKSGGASGQTSGRVLRGAEVRGRGLWIRKCQRGEGPARRAVETRESNSREKQMEGETCAPAGGRGAGRRVRAGTRGGAGKPRRPRGGGDGVTGGRRPSPRAPLTGRSGLGHEGARAGGLGGRSPRALPRARTLTFQVRLRPSSLGESGTSAPRGRRCGTRKN
ncbi:spidroin-1 [Mustela lutreola]|uniref:spidroin-1 n=1 Tax=Mustela lutreola TaxID=9666 RepID=UPI0027971D59|nr:spidroin-1 [Mustela lutreola]